MVNASGKASFYFRGGEYYVQDARLGADLSKFAVGDQVTSDKDGKIVKFDATVAGAKALGVVTYIGEYTNGNMYAFAGTAANGGQYLGFILYM